MVRRSHHPRNSTQIAGSYIRPEWKATLRERLLQVHTVLAAGAIGMTP
jgi:hypothetical protein